jgi:hypothetical protein
MDKAILIPYGLTWVQHTGIHSPTLDTSLASYNQEVLTTTDEVQRKDYNTRGQ